MITGELLFGWIGIKSDLDGLRFNLQGRQNSCKISGPPISMNPENPFSCGLELFLPCELLAQHVHPSTATWEFPAVAKAQCRDDFGLI